MATANAATPAKTARPSRSRAATKATPAKVAAVSAEADAVVAEAAAIAPEPKATAADNTVAKLALVHVKTTRRFEVFSPDEEARAAGIVGSLYFPVGTKVVKVLATK